MAPRGYEVERTGVGEYKIPCPAANYAVVIPSSSEHINIGVDYSTPEDGFVTIVAPGDPAGSAEVSVAIFLGDVS